jgi:signal transduction histidine kinase
MITPDMPRSNPARHTDSRLIRLIPKTPLSKRWSPMDTQSRARSQLAALAIFLADARDVILREWRHAVDRDPTLTAASTVSVSQFNDHIPGVLDAFARRLAAVDTEDRALARADEKSSAEEHGMHRWQQGYDQRETMCEWGHLHLCLLAKLEAYALAQPDVDASVMRSARCALAQLINECVCASALRYSRLKQAEAASRARDLEHALSHLSSLERERGEFWREATHDLRGGVAAISSASSILNRDNVPDGTRAQVIGMLDHSVTSLRGLLDDLMTLARLEAGHERRRAEEFDAAQMLREFCDSLRPVAAARNLFLKTEGANELFVQGDRIKVQRIVQNLVLNAFNITKEGGVQVTWQSGPSQWAVCVQDTGPGFDVATSQLLPGVLKHATEEAHDVESAERIATSSLTSAPAETLPSQSVSKVGEPSKGEGIGLSIVKRLCELLDASLELETEPGAGTTFRVIFPLRYSGR